MLWIFSCVSLLGIYISVQALDGQHQDVVEESVRMTEDRYKWRKYVHGVADPRIEDG